MGLTRSAPQRVEHSDGWAVGNAGRETVLYEQGTLRATVGIDRGHLSSRLYTDSLNWVDGNGEETAVEGAARLVVLARLVEGLEALSSAKIELFPPR